MNAIAFPGALDDKLVARLVTAGLRVVAGGSDRSAEKCQVVLQQTGKIHTHGLRIFQNPGDTI